MENLKSNMNATRTTIEIIFKKSRKEIILKVYNVPEKNYLVFESMMNNISSLVDYYNYVKSVLDICPGKIVFFLSPKNLIRYVVFPQNFPASNFHIVLSFIEDLKKYFQTYITNTLKNLEFEIKVVEKE